MKGRRCIPGELCVVPNALGVPITGFKEPVLERFKGSTTNESIDKDKGKMEGEKNRSWETQDYV